MTNAEYWRGRFSILEQAAHDRGEQYLQNLEDIYRSTEQSVQKEIEAWYGRFAKNNQVSLTEARKMLNAGQLEEFRWTVEQYVKVGEKVGLDPTWMKKLENASARFHISRLEAVQMQIQQQIELLYGNRVDELDQLFREMVSNGYLHGAFEIQRGLGIGWDFISLNQDKLNTLLSRPWTTDGRTFRDRCWTNKSTLVDTVNRELIQGMLRGDPPSRIVTAIQKQFGTDRYKARRLVHTETTYFNAASKAQMYQDMDVKLIEIVETLDSRTCPICQPLDGTVIPLVQYEPGVTVPPFHPNCRGTTCPYFDDMEGERAARTADGEVYYVPSNMTYSQWEKAFVDGGSKAGLTIAGAGDTMELTAEEKWVLNEYVSSGSYKINSLLRSGEELPEALYNLQKYLDSVLAKMPKYEGIVYRSLSFDNDELLKFAYEHKVGSIVTYQAYTSTSTNISFYHENPTVIMKIYSKNGRDIRKYNPEENEVLYEKNMQFLVKHAYFKEGIYFLEMEEMPC